MPALWTALDPGQKAAWDAFAAAPAQELFNSLGDSYFASGYNWFCKCNLRIFRCARTPIPDPPVQARPAGPTIDDFRVCETGTAESDQCVGGAATASSFWGPGFEPSKAFNDNTADGWQTAAGQPTGWIEYQFAAPQNIKRFRFYGSPISPATNIRNFQFQIFTAAAWSTLLSITDAPQGGGVWLPYFTPNTLSETRYRLNVTANWGAPGAVIVREIEMFLADVDASVIIYPEYEFDDAPDYDLVLHVAPAASVGRQVQYPGFAEILATDNGPDQHQTFQTELEDLFGNIRKERAWFARLYRQTREGLRSTAATDRTETID